MTSLLRTALLPFVVVLPVLAGCDTIKEKIMEKVGEKVAEKVVGQATGSEVDIGSSSGSVTMKDPKTGAVARMGASLPDNWPASLPIYPGAKIAASLDLPDGKQVTFTTSEPVDKVFAFYKSKLPGKQEASMDLGGTKMHTTKEGDTSYVAVIGKGDDNTTSVQLQIHTKKK